MSRTYSICRAYNAQNVLAYAREELSNMDIFLVCLGNLVFATLGYFAGKAVRIIEIQKGDSVICPETSYEDEAAETPEDIMLRELMDNG